MVRLRPGLSGSNSKRVDEEEDWEVEKVVKWLGLWKI